MRLQSGIRNIRVVNGQNNNRWSVKTDEQMKKTDRWEIGETKGKTLLLSYSDAANIALQNPSIFSVCDELIWKPFFFFFDIE